MKQDYIKIRGARVHNLKNINVDIPKNKLVVITGVSGSGKSSLAFDTLYAEGQRRYVESLSVYARQFLGVMQKPDVDRIEGISPAISIDQRKAAHNPRSTVGTMTEVYDYLRVLFARVGEPHCPKCGRKVARQTIDQIVEQVKRLPKGKEVLILGPVVKGKKGEHKAVLEEIKRGGFVRARIDGVVQRIEEALAIELDRKKKHNIEVVVDRLALEKDLDRSRLVDSIEIALRLGKGQVIISCQGAARAVSLDPQWLAKKKTPNIAAKRNGHRNRATKDDLIFSEHFACDYCGISLPEIEPRLFSFNSPFGACPSCQGLGKKLEVAPELVMPNKNLSIAEGAIFPWARASHKVGRQGYFWWKLRNLADKRNFSLDAPVQDLSEDILDIILYGDPKGKPSASYGAGGWFEGVVPSLERRYWQTDSEAVREEIKKYMLERKCEACHGRRLRPEALAVTIAGASIDEVVNMNISQAQLLFEKLKVRPRPDIGLTLVARPLIKEISNRLGFLKDVGLEYLTLSREASTLSGGEEQRTRLATQIGSQLTGVLYILDEPSVGLHPRDQERLVNTLKRLRDLGNTVVVIEHDPATVRSANYVIDVGPGAGKRGGRVVFQGTAKQLLGSRTLTGDYLAGRKTVSSKFPEGHFSNLSAYGAGKVQSSKLHSKVKNYLVIKKAAEHNLKNIDVKIPLGKFVCVTGVSGSGKSTLVNDILARALYQKFYRSKEMPGKHKEILGAENLDKVVIVDQSPIGRTPRSNPATYTGAFTHIRDLFSKTKEARIRGYRPGRFSFNVKGGRCEACEGQGVKKIEMYFLPDVYVKCDECRGKRYNQETLQIEYKSKNIADVLEMTVEDALNFFKSIPTVKQKLKTLYDVGLGYIELGQLAPSLSGGEAQRVKLATELSKKGTGKTLYILDEPTTGLHPDDINKLLYVLKELVTRGNTALCVEHNLDLIAGGADHIIDLGPEGGDQGGNIVAQGAINDIIKCKKSYTGRYLKKHKNPLTN